MKRELIRQSITFIGLTFGLCWFGWFSIYFYESSSETAFNRFIYGLPVIGLPISTISLIAIQDGKDGLNLLIKRSLMFKISWKWYLVILIPILFSAVSTFMSKFFYEFSVLYHFNIDRLLGFIVIALVVLLLEEIGWRGYLLPRLQGNFTALKSSIILGVVWGIWHLPLWLLEPERIYFEPAWIAFICFVAHSIFGSIFYTFLFNSTKGSILLVSLYHAAGNVFILITPPDRLMNLDTWFIYFAPYLFISLWVIWRYGPENLSKHKRVIKTV